MRWLLLLPRVLAACSDPLDDEPKGKAFPEQARETAFAPGSGGSGGASGGAAGGGASASGAGSAMAGGGAGSAGQSGMAGDAWAGGSSLVVKGRCRAGAATRARVRRSLTDGACRRASPRRRPSRP